MTMLGEVRNPHGERLDLTFSLPEGGAPRRVVVIGHGVTANKDRAWARALEEALVAAGHAALRFSFSGNGASEGDFRQSCPTKEVQDLGALLDALERQPELGAVPLVYAGHSMGAAVGVLRASADPRVSALASLGGMVDLAGFAQRTFGHLAPGRDLMWDKPGCTLSQEFLDDMARIGSVEPLAERVRVPWLLVHGSEDTVVPIEESERILMRAGGPVELVRIDGADHVFDGAAAGTMAAAVVTWLARRS